MINKSTRLAPFIALLAMSVVLAFGMFIHGKEKLVDDRLVGKKFAVFSAPLLWGGEKQFSPESFAGKVAVVNVFASWCEGCFVEHESLLHLAQLLKKMPTVKIYGVAWKDTPEKIKNYLRKRGNPFYQVVVDTDGNGTIPMGLTGVPETFIVDKNGKIAFHYKTALSYEIIESTILPLLEKLNNAASD